MTKKAKHTHNQKQATPHTQRQPKAPAAGIAAKAKYPRCARDPKAPRKGDPIPYRGVGSRSARSTEKPLTVGGITLGRAAWCRALGIGRSTLVYRLKHHAPEIALALNFRELSREIYVASGKRPRPRVITPEIRAALQRNIRTGRAWRAASAKARRYSAHGETHTLSEWGKILGVNPHTLYVRIHKLGQPLNKALSSEVAPMPKARRKLVLDGLCHPNLRADSGPLCRP